MPEQSDADERLERPAPGAMHLKTQSVDYEHEHRDAEHEHEVWHLGAMSVASRCHAPDVIVWHPGAMHLTL